MQLTFILIDLTTGASPAPMCGDVNLFFNDADGDRGVGEIEIMIAEPGSRRKGIAAEALTLFMAYTHAALGVERWVAKVGQANTASLSLFQRLGFAQTKVVACFAEVHYELRAEGMGSEEGRARAARVRELGSKLAYGAYQ